MSSDFSLKTATLAAKPSSAIIVYAAQGPVLGGEAERIWNETGLDFAAVSKAADFTGKQGQVLDVIAPPNLGVPRLMVAGAGKADDDAAASPAGLRDRGGSLIGKLKAARIAKADIYLDQLDADAIGEVAAGMRLRHYVFDKYKTRTSEDEPADKNKLALVLHVDNKPSVDKAIDSRFATVAGTLLARDLVHEPPNALGPEEFAEVARSLSSLGIDVDILTPTEMKKLGMGALLGVGQGSAREPRLVVMQWHGGKKKDAPLAFVGKGVVFDTGGISLKPGAGMEDMKGDMGGAAAVTGLMKSLATRKAKINAVGVIGVVENMPDGNAYRPGDILTSMSGQTIEVINTDAEGRLVLADALWYTRDRFKPAFMINLATLTGAIIVSLGQDHAGLFSNDDNLAENLTAAGLASGEKVWRMPMGDYYDKLINSRFADMKNTGGRYGGAITAAQFLKRFVKDTPWAHLDIASTAFGSPGTETNAAWASGYGVALLDQLVRDSYEK